jgi:glutamate dehydrogenase
MSSPRNTIESVSGSDLETAKARLIADVARRAADRPIAGLAAFAERLYARAAAEDLTAYDAAFLLSEAESALDRLGERRPGAPRVSILDAPEAGETVIEIVNDDMPFLVDSTMAEIGDTGCDVRLLLHPTFSVARDGDGRLVSLGGAGSGGGRESLIQVRVGRIASAAWRQALERRLTQVLRHVGAAVGDWRAMLQLCADIATDFRAAPPPLPADQVGEAIAFLDWLGDGNFLFLGTRDYVTDASGVTPVAGASRGILQDESLKILSRRGTSLNSSGELRAFHASDAPLIVAKSDLRSLVHRRVAMDYVGVKRFDASGQVIGERRFVGLFTSSAYTRSTASIPYLRLKVRQVIERAGLDPRGHSGKVLLNVLETLPRDEMFQIDADRLHGLALQVMGLVERPRVRVLTRRDAFGRFVAALVHVPRERYTTDIRVRIGTLLEARFGGRQTLAQPSFLDGGLARIHYLIALDDPDVAEPSQEALEADVVAILRTWADRFAELMRGLPADEAERVGDRFRRAFGAAYQDAYPPEQGLDDARRLEGLGDGGAVLADFHDRPEEGGGGTGLRLYHAGGPVPLSDRVPILEHMGLRVIDERTYEIAPAGRPVIFLHDMTLAGAEAPVLLTPERRARLTAQFLAVWTGAADSDGFNRLGLAADLDWQDIAVIRALARYGRQVGHGHSLDHVAAVLAQNAGIAAHLAALFRARFAPGATADADALGAEIEAALDGVASLDDDVILRRLLNLVRAVVRTSRYRGDGPDITTPLAFKIDSRAVADLPRPRPLYEIWVHSPDVEGVHLRFAKVARGGLRWSDRPQDFRTEVLGLVKAQQVKNAVIVPAGAKGGFVPRRLKPGMARDAWLAEGTAAYRTFVGALIGLTDNLDGEAIVPPEGVVRRDKDDPYLVVAADKGTATFSDTANGIAHDAGFWLGDAFASGGSAGYDHKKMGITARGAFVAVTRHFREMDVDLMTAPVSVVGVGDMSGDVFGNGMLLAPTLRLVAAFDHRDIFLDPDPDLAASLAERQRLFALPRSSWADYDKALISKGGGVFSRQAKAIALSPEIQARLGISATSLTPAALIQAILKAPVDLLWFGGIGTYVRAADETDAECGDRANDAVRVVAADVRAKVIGEGANLGMTQRARIAYGLKGGRCNSDAIDNSAGVNCSDVEVNIKIALGGAIASGALKAEARDAFLASMTDAVAGRVLANNVSQTRAISVEAAFGLLALPLEARLMEVLEAEGRLDRGVEFLPDAATLNRRAAAGQGLTRAEIGVLVAYAKMAAKDALIASAVPDEPWFAAELAAYFPDAMAERFGDAIAAHRLKREIVATRLANAMIDLGGPCFATRHSDATGAGTAAVARAFATALAVFRLDDLVAAVDGATAVPQANAAEAQRRIRRALDAVTIWVLRTGEAGVAERTERFAKPIADLRLEAAALLPERPAAERTAEAEAFVAAGFAPDIADALAHLPDLTTLADAVLVAETAGAELRPAAAALFAVADRLDLGRLGQLAGRARLVDRFDGAMLQRAEADIAAAARALAARALAGPEALEACLTARADALGRLDGLVAEGLAAPEVSVSAVGVAAAALADVAA